MTLPHNHVTVLGQTDGQRGRRRQIPVCRRGVVVVARARPAEVVDRHAEVRFKPHGVFDVPAVEHKTLLLVVHRIGIAKNRIQPGVQTAECLVAVQNNVVTERIGAAEIILGTRVVHRRVTVAVDVHLRLSLDPAGVVAVHAGRKAHAHKAAFAAYAVDNRIRPPLLHRVLLPVGGVKIAAVGRKLPVPAGNHVVKRLWLAAAVFHRDAAVLLKRHFPVTVVAAAGRDQHHRGIQHRIAAVAVGEAFVVCAAKERRDRRLDRRRFKVVPINAQHKGMADVAGKPDVRNHARAVRVAEHGGFARLNPDARAQLFAVSAARAAAFFPRWVLTSFLLF